MSKENDSKYQIEIIYIYDEKIYEFQDIACKAVAKIGKIYNETVQKKFL